MPAREQDRPLRLGTRHSALARAQAGIVAGRLATAVEIVPIAVRSDSDHAPLDELAGARAFTGALEDELTAGRIDAAVHSLKDVPTIPVPGLEIAACLERGPVGDVLLRRTTVEAEPLGLSRDAQVGTGSPRRAALLALHAPRARVVSIRGNLPTRIQRCLDGTVDGIVLAQAGLKRLGPEIDGTIRGLSHLHLDLVTWLPAPGQGAIAVQVRADDREWYATIHTLDDADTTGAVSMERRLLQATGGGCDAAFGAHARAVAGGEWRVDVGLLDHSGVWCTRSTSGAPAACEGLLTPWIQERTAGVAAR